jgi:hypothetical protein
MAGKPLWRVDCLGGEVASSAWISPILAKGRVCWLRKDGWSHAERGNGCWPANRSWHGRFSRCPARRCRRPAEAQAAPPSRGRAAGTATVRQVDAGSRTRARRPGHPLRPRADLGREAPRARPAVDSPRGAVWPGPRSIQRPSMSTTSGCVPGGADFGSRAAESTCQPSEASVRATSRPMPRLAPVIRPVPAVIASATAA